MAVQLSAPIGEVLPVLSALIFCIMSSGIALRMGKIEWGKLAVIKVRGEILKLYLTGCIDLLQKSNHY